MTKFSGSSFLVCLLALVLASTSPFEAAVTPTHSSRPFNRTVFPPDFVFGAGSAAYQIEGAAYIDGKGPSNWDHYTKNYPERILDKSNGDVAADFYHRHKEDIRLLKEIGVDSFRFSIAWSRVLPTGRVKGGINQKGVQFYNSLINELIANGIVPFVTIFHWDVPQALEEEYGGFLKRQIVPDFQEYAEFLYQTFGDRVKNWCTLNEPSIFTLIGYDLGKNAPGRCSPYIGNDCLGGDSATEPYIVAHNLLLAHAAASRLYKRKYQATQKGKIGITVVTDWYKPKYDTHSSIEAANRALAFNLGWFLNPVTYGDYPEIMKSIVGKRLPSFTKAESESLIGSFDYVGLNYYTANYADAAPPATVNQSFFVDIQASLTNTKNGVGIGEQTNIGTFFSYPRGLEELLLYVKNKYKNPPLVVTENGVGDPSTLSFEDSIKDGVRIRYLHTHILHVSKAIKEGCNVKGYFIWAFLDDFEWSNGYTQRLGLVYVDFKTLKRHFKYSAYWFKMFLLK